MRATVAVDDELLASAQRVTGVAEVSAVIELALKELIAREAARCLANAGGVQPDARLPPRRRL